MRKPTMALLLAVTIASLAVAAPAAADEPGESDESAQLVREAIALIVNTPGDMKAIEDKIVDARKAPNQEGVDLGLVGEAEQAFRAGDMHQVRLLLERSIGAQPHLGNNEPLPIGQTRGSPTTTMATGAETGIDVVTDALGADRDRSAGDWLVLAAMVILAGAGVWLARRFRPHPHSHEDARA